MNDYTRYTIDDFAKDEFFQSWVLTPTPENDKFWREFLLEHPSKREQVERARQILTQFKFKDYSLSEGEISSLWEKIKTNHHTTDHAATNRTAHIRLLKIAASFAFVVVAISAVYYWQRSFFVSYHTAFGESKSIRLPDGSTVELNSNSSLRFANNWERKDTRELWLEGEAFFNVVHLQNNKPFKVKTSEGLEVRVLGTTFNVYHRTRETKVVLNSGKIQLHLPEQDDSDNIDMRPGDFIEYKEKTFSKKKVNPEVYSAWTQRKLLLDHTSLREIVDMLRNNYGIEVQVEGDTLLNQTASGSMPIRDGESLVDQIAQIFQLKAQKQNNKYVMSQ